MDDLEAKINSVLSDPDMLQKLSSMAQSLGLAGDMPNEVPKEPAFGDIDLSLIQKLSGFAKQSRVDSNQQSLLHALNPYLSSERIGKLEKAMRAAKMAKLASAFLGKNGLPLSLGR